MIKNLVLVGIGGALGSILRYSASLLALKKFSTVFPLGTFIVNITGCFIIGLLTGFCLKNDMFGDSFKLLFIIGFCGGYTTFSAFSSESLRLFESGNYVMFFLYILLSVAIGILAVYLGSLIIK